MSKAIDKKGNRYGRLVVLRRAENASDGAIQWLCQCDCGNTKIIRSSNLRVDGTTNSCGCYRREIIKTQKPGYKHGMYRTRIYRIWEGLKWRCYYPAHVSYKYYGGRGITVCKEWLDDFCAFNTWAINNGYNDNLVIDRIDNNGNYEPDNCRWVTVMENDNNKRNNRYIEHDGVVRTAAEWSRVIGSTDRHIVADRLEKGWSIEDAVTIPVNGRSNRTLIEIDGVTKNLSQWAKLYGVAPGTIKKRIDSGWDVKKAVTTKAKNIKLGRAITINGETKSICDWSKIYGIDRTTIYERVNKQGWSFEQAITTTTKKGGGTNGQN